MPSENIVLWKGRDCFKCVVNTTSCHGSQHTHSGLAEASSVQPGISQHLGLQHASRVLECLTDLITMPHANTTWHANNQERDPGCHEPLKGWRLAERGHEEKEVQPGTGPLLRPRVTGGCGCLKRPFLSASMVCIHSPSFLPTVSGMKKRYLES